MLKPPRLKILSPNADPPAGVRVRILTPHRIKEVEAIVRRHAGQPLDFQLCMAQGLGSDVHTYYPVLVHRSTGSFFFFCGTSEYQSDIPNVAANESFESVYSPGESRSVQKATHNDWEHQLSFFTEWARRLHTAVNQPDVWTAAQGAASAIAEVAGSKDEPFTEEEKLRLGGALAAIERALISQADQNRQDTARIRLDMVSLRKAMDVLGRTTWRRLVYGFLLTYAVSAALDGAGVSELLNNAGREITAALAGASTAAVTRIAGP